MDITHNQITLECTGRNQIDILVWHNKGTDYTVAHVQNPEFLMSLKNHLRKFYFVHMLPRIVSYSL